MRNGLQFFRAQYAWCSISNVNRAHRRAIGDWIHDTCRRFFNRCFDLVIGVKGDFLNGGSLVSDSKFPSAVIAMNSSNSAKRFLQGRIDVKDHSFDSNSEIELLLFDLNYYISSVKKRIDFGSTIKLVSLDESQVVNFNGKLVCGFRNGDYGTESQSDNTVGSPHGFIIHWIIISKNIKEVMEVIDVENLRIDNSRVLR
nr:hypothetical protein [Tanacetum cinerariifolium]